MKPIWIFDLDNTLHNASPHIFPAINLAMTRYVQHELGLDETEANRLRLHYWQRYGATLTGLMRHHGTDPEHFLHHTHDVPVLARMLVIESALSHHLRRLGGRRIVFTNGPRAYALAVLAGLGIGGLFDQVIGIQDVSYRPKPEPHGYRGILRRLGVPAHRCIMVEDSLVNLRTAKRLGMRSVWISPARSRPAYVDLRVASIGELAQCAPRRFA